MTRQIIDVAGARLEYHHRAALTDRQLRPVVLLHPWFGCWQFWRHTVDALPEFDTYAVDLYSLGSGVNWRDFASPHGLADAVGAMIAALRLGPCHVIGNSMGGIAAQVLASTQQDQVESLVLVGTGARIVGLKSDYRQTVDNWIAGQVSRDSSAQLTDALLARRPADPREFETFVDMVANANKAFMGSVLTNAFDLDLRPALPNIVTPTLVVRGERDAARTRTHVEELLAGIPNSKAVEIPDAGHSPQVDSPQVFGKLVRDFLLM